MGTKKAKAAAVAKAGSERTQASIDKLAADVSKNSNERRAANDARWATLMEKTDIKLELEKSNVVVKKRREDFMILTADVSSLDPQAKAACELLRSVIFQEMGLAPPVATASSTPATASSAPATTPEAPGGETNGEGFLDGTPREGFLDGGNIDMTA